MKTIIRKPWLYSLLALCVMGFTACEKEETTQNTDAAAQEETIAVAASETSGISGITQDSVYILHECGKDEQPVAVAEADLSAGITSYLAANYAGYTFEKAYTVMNGVGATKNYIVIIYFNSKPVALKFNADGTFKKVLEQREKKDIKGKGWHAGGRFQHRNGLHKDTIALTSLPLTVQAYFAATYATDTLLKAYRTSDSGYVIISKNNSLFATSFDASANFKARVQLPQKPGRVASAEASALPAAITSYLQNTYPGYAFNKAYSTSLNDSVQGYVVLIDANNTRYAIAFDASGTFIASKTIK